MACLEQQAAPDATIVSTMRFHKARFLHLDGATARVHDIAGRIVDATADPKPIMQSKLTGEVGFDDGFTSA